MAAKRLAPRSKEYDARHAVWNQQKHLALERDKERCRRPIVRFDAYGKPFGKGDVSSSDVAWTDVATGFERALNATGDPIFSGAVIGCGGVNMALTTLPWDAVDHLTDDEAIAAYLDAALEDGDPTLIAVALGDIARAKGIRDLSERTGLSQDQLNRSLAADGKPELSTVMKVVDALGLRLGASRKMTEDAI